MKKYFLAGSAMLVLGGFMASCTHDDFDYSSLVESKKTAYQEVFVKTYGHIDPTQTWGFGSAPTNAARGMTRAVMTETWSGVHAECKFDESVFNMAVPSGAVDLTKGSFTDDEKKATAFYITGNGDFTAPFNFPADCKVYISGTVTSLSANYDGKVTFYNTGTFTFTGATAARHTIINTGTLTVTDYANIGDVYNKGTLVLERNHSQWYPNEGGTADIPNDMHIYSNGEGSVLMPDGGDLKAICDIHGTLYVGNRDQNIVKNVKIQNSTRKYICGIDATGIVENVDGPLETSYVKAEVFSFDGNPIYLLPGGYVDVTTLKVPNSGSHFYGAAGSTGLVEATNFEFGNENDFTHTFSNNIYFKVNGGYIKCDNCYAMGHNHYFNNITEYLESDAHASDNQSDEYALAADRINTGNAAGSPACGEAWSIGTGGTVTIPTDKSETTEGQVRVITTIKHFETVKLIDSGRVFCEDLGQISSNDLDFNDAVFDVYVYSVTPSTQTIVEVDGVVETNETVEGTAVNKTAIVLLAAGGTLPLSVAGIDAHNALGQNPTSTIINTITSNDDRGTQNSWVTSAPKILEYEGGVLFPYESIVEVPIIVRYGNGEILELTADQGWAPHKICVPIGTKWCKERWDIAEVYTNFKDYVGGSQNFWEGSKDENKLYPSEVSYQLPEIEGTWPIGSDEMTESSRNTGTSTSGGYQGETVLSRELR